MYLFLMQWHLVEPESLPEWSRHLFLRRGGFPEEEGGGGGARKSEEAWLPLETLPSAVRAEEMKEELEETLKVSLENSRSVDLASVEAKMLGLVKSRVRVCEGGWWRGTGLAGGMGWVFEGRGARRKRAWPVLLSKEMSFLKFETVAWVR